MGDLEGRGLQGWRELRGMRAGQAQAAKCLLGAVCLQYGLWFWPGLLSLCCAAMCCVGSVETLCKDPAATSPARPWFSAVRKGGGHMCGEAFGRSDCP